MNENNQSFSSPKNEKGLIISETKNNFTQVGEQTYKNNPTMRLISDVMSDSSFRELFDKTFSTWSEAQAILMIMKLYQNIELAHFKKDKNPPNKMEVLGAVQEVMNNSEMRSNVVLAMQNFMEDKLKITDNDKKKFIE